MHEEVKLDVQVRDGIAALLGEGFERPPPGASPLRETEPAPRSFDGWALLFDPGIQAALVLEIGDHSLRDVRGNAATE